MWNLSNKRHNVRYHSTWKGYDNVFPGQRTSTGHSENDSANQNYQTIGCTHSTALHTRTGIRRCVSEVAGIFLMDPAGVFVFLKAGCIQNTRPW